VSAPVPGAVPVAAVAWSGRSGGNYDPPQGAGWITPDGRFIPARPSK
jgi:hypothetical protein